jgi:hypothetical protein
MGDYSWRQIFTSLICKELHRDFRFNPEHRLQLQPVGQ